MEYIHLISIIFCLVSLMLFAIQKFSSQLDKLAGYKLKEQARKATSTPLRGFFTGALATSLFQSSSATTVLTVGLVNAGVITFYQSLGLIFGANVGTTISTQLIAFKITYLAPLIMLAGFLLFRTKNRYTHIGKPIYYFGLLFFCISLIGELVEPLAKDEYVIGLFSQITTIGGAIAVGVVASTLLQSSTVVSSIVVVLAMSGLLSMPVAIGIILGSDIGTTSAALLASWKLELAARRVAFAHLVFNVLGVLAFLPFMDVFISLIGHLSSDVGVQVANGRLLFNLVTAAVFLMFTKQFAHLVEKVVRN
jgi:phosphate:Na+ symporter